MKEPYLSIGEVAKLANISIQTLRYYDQIDLFKPAYTDPVTNYRYYKDGQLYHLDLIKSLKYIGTSLDEIKNIKQQSSDKLLLFLQKQEQIIEERVNKLKEVQQFLMKTKKQLVEQLAIPTFNEVFIRNEEEERILKIATQNLTPEYIPNAYYSSLKAIIENEGGNIASRYGCIFPLKEYKSIHEIHYHSVFTPLITDRYIHNISDEMEVSIKHTGDYLCIAFIFNPENYFTHYIQLKSYIKAHNLSVHNEVYEIFMPTNYSSAEDEFVVELKVRLK